MHSIDQNELSKIITHYAQLILKKIEEMREKYENYKNFKGPKEIDLRLYVEQNIKEFCSVLKIEGVESEAKLELSGGRVDAVFSKFAIEFKKPGTIDPDKEDEKLREQLKKYLRSLSKNGGHAAGAVFDGNFIIFARYEDGNFIMEKPMQVNEESLKRLLRWIYGLASGKALNAKNLMADFSIDKQNNQKILRAFYDAFQGNIQKPMVRNLYEQWKSFFSQSIDYSEAFSENKLRKIQPWIGITSVKVSSGEDAKQLFFVLHTYFALIVKLIAWLVLSRQVGGKLVFPYFGELSEADSSTLKKELKRMESGGIFRKFGINNLLEGDFFIWYLYAWNNNIEKAIRDILDKLKDYDPSSLSVVPEENRDLFKMLYHYLLPKKIRHNLGEYYTPDWLAERLLQNIDKEFFTKDIAEKEDVLLDKLRNLRWLDPACGSGTFLVIIISRMTELGKASAIGKQELLELILNNVVGFDINPLAVITARVNYILAILNLLEHRKGNITIPVYLADSIITPSRIPDVITKSPYKFSTYVGKFLIPASLCTKDKFDKFCELLEKSVNDKQKFETLVEQIKKKLHLELYGTDIDTLKQTYNQLIQLKNRGMNGVWARILKNNFAPLTVGQFDYIVGNPPWINWEHLPDEYRKDTKPLWKRYGLFVHSGMSTILGSGKKDISMLMTYVVCDKLLKKCGKLGFIITQSVFKTSASGGFRKFSLPDGIQLKVLLVEDMTSLQPFEGASNRTALIVLQKGKCTTYPITYILWKKKKKSSFKYTSKLEEVLKNAEIREDFVAERVYPKDNTSHWLTVPRKTLGAVRKVIKKSFYTAREGANTGGANGVYWVNIIGKCPNGLVMISNLIDHSKIKLKNVRHKIEPDLLYPLLKGGDVKRWKAEPSAWIIMAQDPNTRKGIEENEMKSKYKNTYCYLEHFKEILRNRALFKKYFTDEDPFYSMFNVGTYTFERWKVVWPIMASTLNAAVIGSVGNKVIIPQNTITLVACKSEEEAHYICAVINSRIANFVAKSYAQEGGKSFGSPHILNHIGIPAFDSTNNIHKELACLSMKAHKCAGLGCSDKLKNVEQRIDQLCAKLWGISDDELELILEEMRKLYPEEQEFKI